MDDCMKILYITENTENSKIYNFYLEHFFPNSDYLTTYKDK